MVLASSLSMLWPLVLLRSGSNLKIEDLWAVLRSGRDYKLIYTAEKNFMIVFSVVMVLVH